MAAIVRYAARVKPTQESRRAQGPKARSRKDSVAIIGAGKLASFLALALKDAGCAVTEIICRPQPHALRRARALAKRVGAKAVTAKNSALDASLLWFCVPDREIGHAAAALAERWKSRSRPAARNRQRLEKNHTPRATPFRTRFAFHSSGALLSDELKPLRNAGLALASVHPLMTFVEASRPSLSGVPFALEGDPLAIKLARRMVRALGAASFTLPPIRKPAYHAWATMTSPLLVAYLLTLEEAARAAGLPPARARRMSLPIILQTLSNYARLGPPKSFSGPLIRGDLPTVARHLSLLRSIPMTRAVYVALARVATGQLPAKHRAQLRRLLE